MKDLQQIALADLENDKIYLLALTSTGYNEFPLDLKTATGSDIRKLVLTENEYLFDEDDIRSDNEKLQLIEDDFDVEVYAVAFIIP